MDIKREELQLGQQVEFTTEGIGLKWLFTVTGIEDNGITGVLYQAPHEVKRKTELDSTASTLRQSLNEIGFISERLHQVILKSDLSTNPEQPPCFIRLDGEEEKFMGLRPIVELDLIEESTEDLIA